MSFKLLALKTGSPIATEIAVGDRAPIRALKRVTRVEQRGAVMEIHFDHEKRR